MTQKRTEGRHCVTKVPPPCAMYSSPTSRRSFKKVLLPHVTWEAKPERACLPCSQALGRPQAPQEAAQRLRCIHCPAPLGPREHLSWERRHWRGDGVSRCGRGGKIGEMVAPLGSLPISSRNSLHLASKPGEKCKLKETNNGLCMKYFNKHLLFRCIYQDNQDNVWTYSKRWMCSQLIKRTGNSECAGHGGPGEESGDVSGWKQKTPGILATGCLYVPAGISFVFCQIGW